MTNIRLLLKSALPEKIDDFLGLSICCCKTYSIELGSAAADRKTKKMAILAGK